MYYVPEGTKKCSFYDCGNCGMRFLSEETAPKIICPYCYGKPKLGDMDMELGPDEEMPTEQETAQLLEVIEGEEEVERMDALLSLAVTGGDFDWL